MNRKTTRSQTPRVMIPMQTRPAWVVGAAGGGSRTSSTMRAEERGDRGNLEGGTAVLGPCALLSMALAILAGVAVGKGFDVSWESATAALLVCLGGIALLTMVGPEQEGDGKDQLQQRS